MYVFHKVNLPSIFDEQDLPINTSRMATLLKLNKTEKEILQKIKEGLTSSQIALQRGCSARTVEKHRSNIIKKLGIKSSQNTLIIWAMQNQDTINT